MNRPGVGIVQFFFIHNTYFVVSFFVEEIDCCDAYWKSSFDKSRNVLIEIDTCFIM